MSWETYTPATSLRLAAGEASLGKCGSIRLVDSDLEEAGIIGNRVVVLMDREERRIALRMPGSKAEPTLSVNKENSVYIGTVIRRMGLKLIHGVRCKVVVNGDQLIVLLPLEPVEPARIKATPIQGDAR